MLTWVELALPPPHKQTTTTHNTPSFPTPLTKLAASCFPIILPLLLVWMCTSFHSSAHVHAHPHTTHTYPCSLQPARAHAALSTAKLVFRQKRLLKACTVLFPSNCSA